MKLFALLGLAAFVHAESEFGVARRRRLALAKCSFVGNEATGSVPNCMATYKWTMKDGDVDKVTPVPHGYRCCTQKHTGWKDVGKKQLACTEPKATSTTCVDVKKDEESCLAKLAKVTKTDSFYSPGYSTTTCSNKYADDCRASVTCDTAGGYRGIPDLACKAGFNNQFLLRGCARADAGGELGKDATTKIYIVAPHTWPNRPGNIKSSFDECVSSAIFFKAYAFVASNGGCDAVKCSFSSETTGVCGVLPTWDLVLRVSEGQDTFLRPFLFKSEVSEPCIDVGAGKQPTGSEAAKVCPNGDSMIDKATYGGFRLYGQRLNCWRNMGGGFQATEKSSKDLTALDLTRQVMTATVNAGIGKTFKAWNGEYWKFWGLWNDAIENGYGVCDGVDEKLGGCTAELGALMCEAYNKHLYNTGATKVDDFCTGFVLQESAVAMGSEATGKKSPPVYKVTHKHDMLIGFFSNKGADTKYNPSKSWNGGMFKYIPITDCLVTATHSCSVCEKCIAGKVKSVEGTCIATCPAHQYAKDGVCTYRSPHCIAGNADGTECTKCHSGFKASATDKAICEEIGCPVPATALMKSKKGDLLVGKEQGTSPACTAGQNLVPGSSCGITCGAGKFSSDPGKSHIYDCKAPGAPVPPEIICTACDVTKCDSCPSAKLCDTCASGYVLSADKKKCDAKACPNGGTPGACTVCPLGTAGTLSWDFVAQDWDTSACEACSMSNCKDCKGNKAVCITCATDYTKKAADGKECIELEYCPYGQKGRQTWVIATQKFATTSCTTDATVCEDAKQPKGACTDCKDGYAGKVDWDYVKQAWNKDQCHAIPCPVPSEPVGACKTCPLFMKGTPKWDDLFNQWAGCIASDFGFSGPSASWAGSVSADRADIHIIETKSAEAFHVANAQYDAIKEEWLCDEGYAGVGCRQRLCPETVAFTSGTDTFTPSKSVGVTYASDAGMSTSSTFSNQHSYRECGGRGSCDFETGICQCFPGFTGVGCRRTTCPNSCSGHGVCVNDDVANYHAAGNTYLPDTDKDDVNTWGNLWAANKFQGCRCDGGWGGNDCSLRQCPRGDDPETQCDDDLDDDIQWIECTNLMPDKEHFFKLRFTDLLGNRYNSRAIVIEPHEGTVSDANKQDLGTKYCAASSKSIQTALESLPNFAIPKVEVTTTTPLPQYKSETKEVCTETKVKKKKVTTCKDETKVDYTKAMTVKFAIEFKDARNSGQQALIEIVSNVKCESGVQPKFTNTIDPTCTVSRAPIDKRRMRENTECSNRGLCNRKTAECNCFDGYTGLACDTVAQTY